MKMDKDIFTLEIEIEGFKYELIWYLKINTINLFLIDSKLNKVLFDKIIVNTLFETVGERINYIKNEIIPLFEAVG